MPFKPSSVLFALTLSLGAMLADAGPKAKAAAVPSKSQAASASTAPSASGSPVAPANEAGAPAAAPAAPAEANEATVVYLGKTGSRYHLKGCRYLKGAGKEITVGDAMKKGYAPCNVCKAPRLKH